MVNFRQIDWRLNVEAYDPIGATKFITELKLTILDRGMKHFEQAPMGVSTSDTLVPISDLAPWALDKFVFGFLSWGIPINVPQDIWMWTPHVYINWKRNYFRPPIATYAVRVWLYEFVEAHADVNWYYPAEVDAKILLPPVPNPH